jgi:iron complex outermembrane receptor protein
MRNNKIRLAISLLLFTVPLLLYSQTERSVKGRVTTNNRFPLVNASVLVKSTGETFFTDSLGYFDIKCRNKDKLVITAIGFTKKTEKISPDVTELLVDMKLKAGERNLDLALGKEGSIREEDRDVMFKMNNAEEDFSIYPNIYDAIRGRVPGVRISGDEIYLRGNTSLSPGGNGALMVVDGVIVSKLVFVSTPTSDIKSIRVLKGSEASIYGSRGGNGVIEVYTKRGLKK